MAKPKSPEVGKEVLAACKKCKADTAHVITVIKDDIIKKVLCSACKSEHVYRKPEAEKAANAKAKKTTTRRRSRKKDWPSLIAKIEETDIVDYDISSDFSETPAIRHKTFGIGVITKVLGDNKIEVVFEQDKKILAQNWPA